MGNAYTELNDSIKQRELLTIQEDGGPGGNDIHPIDEIIQEGSVGRGSDI